MVFSSIPAYLDPSNWQQQPPNHQVGSSGGGGGSNHHQLPPPPPPLPPQPHVGGGSGSIRPGSMADRARMANIPFPETALKCPRCESTNTKFCYFNNYSLTQPRHFCKTCRRYWTRGGALRNVPVGGGCRRNNKRSKGSGSSSKSPASSGGGDSRQTGPNSSSGVSTNSGTASLLGLSSQIPNLPFMAPLHQFSDYGEIGLNYSGISAPMVAGGGGGGGYLSAGGLDQWRLQQPQLPLFSGLDIPSGLLYPFQGGHVESSGYVGEGSHVRPKLSGPGISQMGSVKMEDSQDQMGLSRQFLGIPGNDQQYNWNGTTGTAWTDLSGFSTSSSSNPL